MFRLARPRSLHPVTAFSPPNVCRTKIPNGLRSSCLSSVVVPSVAGKRPQAVAVTLYKSTNTSLQRYAATATPYDAPNKKEQDELYQKMLERDPEEVTSDSSVIPVMEGGEDDKGTDMLAGVKSDLKTIKDTFALTEVPREAFYIGLAGVLPYLATSMSTVYLAWDINHAWEYGSGFLLSGQTAELLLHVLEPIQIGYGAVIISFLGAIHWGLEFGGYGGYQRYKRYAVGVVAPAVAWPTLLFPVEYALITQFLAFNFLYLTDARATVKGWFPAWYSTYRFVLTFIVGTSIVMSLISRGHIADRVGKLPSPAEKVLELRKSQTADLEKEEDEREEQLMEEEEGEEA
ncbi:MAG: hypothetical protein M1833_004552 [Piccolia ochrophora]|nr:MAG: hypothetical protein M1833_004552 [Piccolia ochrophora]